MNSIRSIATVPLTALFFLIPQILADHLRTQATVSTLLPFGLKMASPSNGASVNGATDEIHAWSFGLLTDPSAFLFCEGGSMAKDRLSMRKFKEVMRLKYEHELTNRKIACFDRCLHGPGRYLIVVPSEKSLKRARSKIYDMTIRRITAPVQKVIGAVNRFLTGWGNISDLVIPELHLKRSIGMCKRGSVALSGRGVTGAAGTLKARHCNKR